MGREFSIVPCTFPGFGITEIGARWKCSGDTPVASIALKPSTSASMPRDGRHLRCAELIASNPGSAEPSRFLIAAVTSSTVVGSPTGASNGTFSSRTWRTRRIS